jgi:hypothetical protein
MLAQQLLEVQEKVAALQEQLQGELRCLCLKSTLKLVMTFMQQQRCSPWCGVPFCK